MDDVRPPAPFTWPPPPRGYRWGCATGLTVVATVLLCAILSVVQYLNPPRGSAFVATSPTAGPVGTSVVLVASGEQILYSSAAGVCRQRTLQVQEDVTGVRLSASYQDIDLDTCVRFHDRATQTLLLSLPVGTRPVIDAATGAPV